MNQSRLFDCTELCSCLQYGKYPRGGPTHIQCNFGLICPITTTIIGSSWTTDWYQKVQECGPVKIILAWQKKSTENEIPKKEDNRFNATGLNTGLKY